MLEKIWVSIVLYVSPSFAQICKLQILISYFSLFLFIGSSTDLVTSVIGYYDQLTINNNHNNNNNSIQVAQQQNNDLNIVSTTKETTATSCTTATKKQVRNIRILSPTVQRIISQSGQTIDASSTTITTNNIINNNNNNCQSPNTGVNNGHILQKRVGQLKSNSSTKTNSHSHIPLSKNISKFTQSANELIESIDPNKCTEIIDDSNNHDDDDEDPLKTPTNLSEDITSSREIIPTTPTNLSPNPSFLYCTLRRSQEHIKLDESLESLSHDFGDNLSIDDSKNPPIPKLQYTSSTSSADSTFIRPKMNCAQNNKVYHDTDSDDGFTESVGEASNFYIKLPDDVRESMKLECDRSTVIFREIPTTKNGTSNNNNNSNSVTSASTLSLPTPTIAADEKISYSKKKILLAKTNSNSNSSSSKENLKTEGKKEEKSVSVKSQVVSQNVNQNGNKLSVPDEKKMKNRPLSATSITSTSSSSSSGSNDHLNNGKLNISYLASVESLADHSESELVNSSNLTVSERAALEMIDSEKSYVADLDQVIHG